MTTQIALASIHGDPLASLGGTHHGGQNVYVKELARHLGASGFRVDVFSRWESREQPAIEHIDMESRVVRVQVGPARVLPKEHTMLFLSDLAEWIDRFREENRAEYRLIHSHYYFSGAVGLALRGLWHVPLVQTFHSLGMVKRQALGGEDPSPTRRLKIERRIAQGAERIVATAPQEKHDLDVMYGADPSRIRVIPCGVNLELFRPLGREEARAYVDIPADRFLLTFVGRLETRKGVDTLLKAMGMLLTGGPDLPLHAVIVGGPPKDAGAEMPEQEARQHRQFQEIIDQYGMADRVTFTGGLPQNVLYNYYSASDVTVVPSYYEPFGMTAVEALACGSSVIASRVGGLKTTVKEGHVGLQFEPRNAQDLADKIAYLVQNPQVNTRLRGNARPYAESNYGWRAVARRVAATYREVLGEHPEESRRG